MDDRSIAALAERADIEDVIFRFCHAIDRKNWSCLDNTLTADVHISVPGIECESRAEFVAQTGAIADFFAVSHHQVGNIQIVVTGDQATAISYVNLYHRTVAGATGSHSDHVRYGVWSDAFRRAGGLWRLQSRTWHQVFAHLCDGVIPDSPGDPGAGDDSAIVVQRWVS